MSQRTKYPKSDLRHWQAKIHKSTHNWTCFFQKDGVRKHLSLNTASKEVAAAKAREIHRYLIANGWQMTLEKFRPKSARQSGLTIGQFLAAVRNNCEFAQRTRLEYESCLKRIVSDIFRISRSLPRDEWLQKVEARKLAELTPEKIQQWKIAFVKERNSDPKAERKAKISCTSTLRQAKGLFSKRVIAALANIVELPSPLPFSQVKGYERQSMRYQGGLDIAALIHAAQTELESEPFKIFLLGCMAGLRRKEIDLLEWDSFNWNTQEIQVKTTRYFEAKSEYSLGAVQVDPELIEIFRGFHARATTQFVIEGKPPKSTNWNRYRCQTHFETLTAWLRAHGVQGEKLIHVLRKEFGSQINAQGGIFAASRALRHADLAITSQFYTDARLRVVTGFGRMLKSPANIVPMEGAA